MSVTTVHNICIMESPLTVIINGTVLIISNMKDIWNICSQMFP